MYSNKENVNILTSLMVEYGVRHVVVCPGSRNAPLVHNFTVCPSIHCHPVTDERSAAFVAMGIAQQTEDIVAVCVTSGSALLNVLPGVAEATYQHRGILVISADRPSAWIGQLDGQTMPQVGILGNFVGKSVSIPECKDDLERWHCRRTVCEVINKLIADSVSVHINVPIGEPLFEFSTPELPAINSVPVISLDEYRNLFNAAKRPMIVCGQHEDICINVNRGVVILAEQLSTSSPSPSLDRLFQLMGENQNIYKPDFLLYIGGTTISKALRQFMRTLDLCVIVMHNTHGELEDISQHARFIVKDDLQLLLDIEKEHTDFSCRWNELIERTRLFTYSEPETLEAKAVKEFEKLVEKNNIVYYANSSAIRFGAEYANHYIRCNRGLNGIEGSLSTAVGASLVTEDKVYCIIGDLSFFYDQNALWNQQLRGNLRILLLNNGGGAIFKKLPGLSDSPAMREFVMGRHKTTAVGACHQYGFSRRMVSKAEQLADNIMWLVNENSNCPLLLEVITK